MHLCIRLEINFKKGDEERVQELKKLTNSLFGKRKETYELETCVNEFHNEKGFSEHIGGSSAPTFG